MAPDTVLNAALQARLIAPNDTQRLRTILRAPGADTVDALSCAARVPATAIYQALASAQGMQFIDIATVTPDGELVKRVPRILMQRKQVLPLSQSSAGILIAIADPADQQTADALRRAVGQNIQFALAEPRALRAAIERHIGMVQDPGTGTAILVAAQTAGPDPVGLLDEIFREAYIRRATDIHLEPQPDGFRVRYRVDGYLQVFRSKIPMELGAAVLSRVKVLSNLDIAESREPQDGSFSVKIPGVERGLDLRVATAPTREGERATMRLLGTDAEDLTLEMLGFPTSMLDVFRSAIRQPHGMILNTGATGCGKTTTLYAALREINSPDLNIVTVEDPVEYPIAGVSQLQIDPVGKLTFAGALRSLLRHDPDVVMIGEIRDAETADISIRASMTGHLVFSTLHTNSSCGAVSRLMDMECEPFLLASTLSLIIAQRLVRRLCPDCKKARPSSASEASFLQLENGQALEVFEPGGCIRCLNTGYRGRVGVFEMLSITGELPRAISRGAPEHEIYSCAQKQGFETLVADARRKVFGGVTSLSEARAALVVEA